MNINSFWKYVKPLSAIGYFLVGVCIYLSFNLDDKGEGWDVEAVLYVLAGAMIFLIAEISLWMIFKKKALRNWLSGILAVIILLTFFFWIGIHR